MATREPTNAEARNLADVGFETILQIVLEAEAVLESRKSLQGAPRVGVIFIRLASHLGFCFRSDAPREHRHKRCPDTAQSLRPRLWPKLTYREKERALHPPFEGARAGQ